MPHIRMTLVRPKPGRKAEMLRLLEELDGMHWQARGLLFSAAVQDDSLPDGRLRVGRISFWQSKAMADLDAKSDRILAIQSSILALSEGTIVESLLEAWSGWFPVDLWPKHPREKFATGTLARTER